MFETTPTTPVSTTKSGISRRGFASMSKDRHKLVSSIGGKAPRIPNSEKLDTRLNVASTNGEIKA